MDAGRWEEIHTTFAALVELDPATRATRLETLGTTDPELRAAVESLLGADAEVDQRLASLESALLPVATCAPDLLGLTGHSISHFRVLEPLGTGGMGVVYRAEDTRLNRPVALKFLLPHISLDAVAKARFLREARSVAALDHPNLCTVHEVGESEDGRLFLAMALYRGETLKARLAREGTLPLSDALAITREIAEGLSSAHAAGIVHRDLKPGNIMVLPEGSVKILDFGLAMAGDQSLSSSSARAGTAAYMAPEQVLGKVVDGRADLWALGVVLYEMVTGQRPFAGERDVAIAHGILYIEPVPPSTLRADVPEAVEDMVLTLLQKDPAERYVTAEEFVAHLNEAQSAPSTGGQSPKRRSRTSRRTRRSWRAALRAGAALGILGVLSTALLFVRGKDAQPAEPASRVVVMPFENRTGVNELDPLGTMAAEWVTQGLTQVPFLTVLNPPRKPRGTSAGPLTIGRQTGAGVVVVGSYFLQGDSLQFQSQIASTSDGSVLFAIGGVATPRASPMSGVEQVRERVSAGVASLLDRDVSAFQSSLREAPTYAAYREYIEGLESYMGRPGGGGFSEAARHFQQAAALDSTFLTALVWAAQSSTLEAAVQMDMTWARKADSLLTRLQPLRDRMSPFDRARLNFVMALRDGNLVKRYGAALDMLDASPGSFDARREVALSAANALRPRETLRRLSELNANVSPRFGWEAPYWGYVASVKHVLGQHVEELAAARRLRSLDPSNLSVLSLELGALTALGSTAEVDSLARIELPSTGHSALIAFGIAGELMAHGHPEVARRVAQYASDNPGAPPPSEPTPARDWLTRHLELQRFVSVPYCYLGGQTSTPPVAERAREEWVHSRAELALLLGDLETAARRMGELHDPKAHGLLLARLLAARGRRGAAREALAQWEEQMVRARGTLNGFEIDRASVLVRLGDTDRALEILAGGIGRRALASTTTGWDGHAYPDLAPLWSHPRFKALVRPRG